jgi:hypothetical protein
MYRVQSDKHLVCFAGGDSSKISFGAESEMHDLVAKFEVWTVVNTTSGIIPLIVSKHSQELVIQWKECSRRVWVQNIFP